MPKHSTLHVMPRRLRQGLLSVRQQIPEVTRELPSSRGIPAVPEALPQPVQAQVCPARRMNLSITRVDPWSVTKMAFMLSIAGAIIQLVAVTLIWFIVDAVGLFDVVNELGTRISSSFNLTDILSLPRVIGAITILSVFEIVIICVMAAIGALLYNVSSRLVGGIHVTLGDD